ncbi:hypothetical protein [Vagococcus acidifermentans]|uniref:N-acetyltransferase domain-containing protein n=1 Tax=Vagococcus acidifermentans TaxID=564710 RepID=A0A430AS89_9ENTE|nr:hypothetical protein [Vagococcus acidifermentans]RSU10900.1 hypothetical protein CBF27_09400 [Vagococcus acidifermentans]
MAIRPALANDVQTVNTILKQAAHRIKLTGSLQWAHVLEDGELPMIHERINNGTVYLYMKEQEAAGVFYLYEEPTDWDVRLWGDARIDGVYYLHKVALADSYTGKNEGQKLLEAVKTYRPSQITEIRLDCMAEKAVLNNLYSRSGFSFHQMVRQVPNNVLMADFNLYTWRRPAEELS